MKGGSMPGILLLCYLWGLAVQMTVTQTDQGPADWTDHCPYLSLVSHRSSTEPDENKKEDTSENNLSFKERATTSLFLSNFILMRTWRRGNLYAQLVWMQIGAAIMENSLVGPSKIKNRTLWPVIPILDIYPEETKSWPKEIPVPPRSLQHYSRQPRHGNNLSVCLWWMGKKMWYLHVCIIQPQKEGNPAICGNMDENLENMKLSERVTL